MDDQELLQMMVVEPWERYRRADRREKLALLRHSFSMYIPHADRGYEFLRIVLDDRAELEYSVNKAAAVSDDYTLRGFVRFVFALKEGETKLFTWVTAHGNKEWILSRDSAVLYVDVPEFGEGFFIRYGVFRDECFAAYEKVYAWGYQSDIQRIEVPERDLESLTWLEPEEEFELVRYLSGIWMTADRSKPRIRIDCCGSLMNTGRRKRRRKTPIRTAFNALTTCISR